MIIYIICYLVYIFACFFRYYFRKKPYPAMSLTRRILSVLAAFGIGTFLALGSLSAVMNYYRNATLFDTVYCVVVAITAFIICGMTVFPFFFKYYGTKKSKGIDFYLQFILLTTIVALITFFLLVIIVSSISKLLFK